MSTKESKNVTGKSKSIRYDKKTIANMIKVNSFA